MHIEEELRLGEKLFEPARQLVERLERVLDRPRPLRFQDSLQEGAAFARSDWNRPLNSAGVFANSSFGEESRPAPGCGSDTATSGAITRNGL